MAGFPLTNVFHGDMASSRCRYPLSPSYGRISQNTMNAMNNQFMGFGASYICSPIRTSVSGENKAADPDEASSAVRS